jgi:hypothetical protein
MYAEKLERLWSVDVSLTVNYVANPCTILVMIASILLAKLAHAKSINAGKLRIEAASALGRKKAS